MYRLDSREINKNDIFIDLIGSEKNIEDAIKRGCKYSITELNINDPKIKHVDNVQEELNRISRNIRKKFNGVVIAVTGSNGKTTTKEIIYNILSSKYKVLKNIDNENNHIGVPKTLLKLNNDYDICVLEIGMNHKGEIKKISDICRPDIGVITNIGTAHIGLLGSKKNIFLAKLEILNGIKDGILIVNGNDKYLKKIKYSNVKKIKKVKSKIINNKLNFTYDNTNYIYNIPNKKLINNLLISIYIGKIFNIEENIIKEEIENYKPLNGRSNIIKCNNYMVVDDTYNASYESIKLGLETIKNYDLDKIIILGDVLETKKYIYKKINKLVDNNTILVGENMESIKKGIHFKDIDELIKYLSKINLNNKLIYLKASHKMNFEKVVDYLINIEN